MKTSYLIIAVVVVVAIFGIFALNNNKISEEEVVGTSQAVPAPGFKNVDEMIVSEDGLENDAMKEKEGAMMDDTSPVITYTDAGFSPNPLNVRAGDTVIFKNESSRNFWPASAQHPTHTVYPNSNIKKCGSSEAKTILDACGGIAPDGTYSFTFNEVGEWGYHNHLNASKFGKIIVQ